MYKAFSRKFHRDCLVVQYTVSTGGSAALTRLFLPNQNLGTSSLLVPANTQGTAVFRWEHGQDTSEAGGPLMELEVQTRLSTGSNAASTFNPHIVTLTSATLIDDSSSTGNPELM